MYGPSNGQILRFLFVVALIGGLLAIGADRGCSYVRAHVKIEWK